MGARLTRVLIAAASASTRAWFSALPARADRLAIVAIAGRDGGLAAHVQELAPDVVVIDATDGDEDAITAALRSVGDPAIDVVLLMNGESWQALPSDLLRDGVRGVLPPQPTIEELDATIGAVSAGLIVLEPRLFETLGRSDDRATTRTTTGGAAPALHPSGVDERVLTPREIDVLNALAEGLGNKQIAVRLAISEHTVKTHLAAIFEKLEASNRTEAVMAGARLGLVLL